MSDQINTTRADDGDLTLREKQILEQVALGMSAKESAKYLSIAPRTVERHIENIRLKLRARNNAHLIARAFAVGALPATNVRFGEHVSS